MREWVDFDLGFVERFGELEGVVLAAVRVVLDFLRADPQDRRLVAADLTAVCGFQFSSHNLSSSGVKRCPGAPSLLRGMTLVWSFVTSRSITEIC